jgi:hypothetical protein
MTILSLLFAMFFNTTQPVNVKVDRNEDPGSVVVQAPTTSPCETDFIIPTEGNL